MVEMKAESAIKYRSHCDIIWQSHEIWSQSGGTSRWKCDTLSILHHESILSCDTGASTHVTREQECMSHIDVEPRTHGWGNWNHRHNGIPGVFMSKNGDIGMLAILKECSYYKAHNFNLFSMLWMLPKQGWKNHMETNHWFALKMDRIE